MRKFTYSVYLFFSVGVLGCLTSIQASSVQVLCDQSAQQVQEITELIKNHNITRQQLEALFKEVLTHEEKAYVIEAVLSGLTWAIPGAVVVIVVSLLVNACIECSAQQDIPRPVDKRYYPASFE